NKVSMLGLIIVAIILFCAIFASLIIPYNAALDQDRAARLLSPSRTHFLGTDMYGRDVFARIIYGTRYSLLIGLGAVAIGISCGSILGSIASYYGGMLDTIIMRIIDVLACIPFILLALTVVAALGPGLFNLLIALTIAYIPQYTRIVRAAILPVVGRDFVEASKACGASDFYIMMRHLIPNAIGVVAVQATMMIGKMIISASTLSFLGMGIQPPTPEWGSMLAEGRDYLIYAPHIVIFSGLAIVITVLAFNLIGDGLRDALDPKLRD
ncbi:MAG: ABC transporter permease, partial [Acholeplasmataceae bacterium]|nr:ABC transporter permease [Acholeplasmataceae bacterium]